MDLVALSLCTITTRAMSRTLEQGVEWNAKSIHYGTLAVANITTCQVIKLLYSVTWGSVKIPLEQSVKESGNL